MPSISDICVAVIGPLSRSRLYTAYSSGRMPAPTSASVSTRRRRCDVTKKSKRSEISARLNDCRLYRLARVRGNYHGTVIPSPDASRAGGGHGRAARRLRGRLLRHGGVSGCGAGCSERPAAVALLRELRRRERRRGGDRSPWLVLRPEDRRLPDHLRDKQPDAFHDRPAIPRTETEDRRPVVRPADIDDPRVGRGEDRAPDRLQG